jgi:DNA-directed RNA polymerase specialized sigma54-like protein
MSNLEIQQTQSLQTRQEFKLVIQLEQANLLEMPEEEFNRLTTEVESSPLFKKLYRKERIVHYQRYPKTDLSSHFYQLNEEIAAGGTGTLDVETLLSDKEGIVRQIQKIGLENFKRYFLYPEPGVSVEEIAKECNLKLPEVEKINSLINEFSVMSEFYHPSTLSSGRGIHYSKVASIERGLEGFVIGYLSPSYARGRYSIDYERFEELKGGGAFSAAEAKEIRKLFKRLELINSRKDTVTRILQGIVEKQALYFESGNGKAVLPFSQKELAERIGLVPSSISRAISGKSIETPWGEEKALKDFFPRPKMFKKELVKQLLETGEEFPSDEAIKAKLEQKFGVSISRRLVASLRKELKIPVAWKREKQLSKKAKGG